MPEPSSKKADISAKILANINNVRGLYAILRDIVSSDQSVEDKIDFMNLVFATESKTNKYDLIPFLWNFLRKLYLAQNKDILKLIPSVVVDRNHALTEKQLQNFIMIITPVCYMMSYHQDTNQDHLEIILKNVLHLTKCLLGDKNYVHFFNFIRDSIFSVRTFRFKIFTKMTPATETFLRSLLARLWEFREVTEGELKKGGLTVADLYEKLFQFFIFYVNYEADQTPCTYALSDELISVILNLNIAKPSAENGNSKDIGNCIKCLYYLLQFMKGKEDPVSSAKGLHQYMARICDKAILNSHPVAVDTLATVGLVLEKNKHFQSEENLKAMSKETVKYLLQTIKLTVGLNVEPQKTVCDIKDCNSPKKHTIANLNRFAQKIFLAYVSQLSDKDVIDEELLAIVMQLIIFHFHVMARMTCTGKTVDEHNDIRRIYSTFAHRTKANPHPSVLKIFETLLKYSLQRSLLALGNPIAMLLGKYYGELGDEGNSNRMEWINLCLHQANAATFENYTYNWAVRKQFLAREAVVKCLKGMRDTDLDYQSDAFPGDLNPRDILIRMLEQIAARNLRAFRQVEEALVEVIMTDWQETCSEEQVNVLFYAPEGQLMEYKEAIERHRKYFLEEHGNATANGKIIALAVTHSLQYQLYVEKLRKDLKVFDLNVLLKKPADLSLLSLENESKELVNLKQSLEYLKKLPATPELTPSQCRQVMGTLKRNIRHFQLAGWEFEEVSCCVLLYELSKHLGEQSVDAQLLAMANLMNHIHFIVKDEECRNKFPHLIRQIATEGSQLFCSQVKSIQDAKEPLQILIVFGLCNMIKLNADLGRREQCYDYLEYLKQKIDEINGKKDGGGGGGGNEPSVIEMQYNLISYELFVKYSAESRVNHLLVVREIFGAVRQMYKVSDLYALSLYDVLVELFTFSVPRYETKGLDFYIQTVLKYFIGLGSVTRILDILLMYSNWVLCCESLEKCFPTMDYVANIVTGWADKGCIAVGEEINEEENLKKITTAVEKLDLTGPVRLAIVGFKLNCLVARKCYIDRNYEQSRKLYEHAWRSYEAINERINNFALKVEFQQFFVNALFQLSNVYYKIGMSTESLKFCETTTIMIRDIRVNRIALTQEARFQGMNFKSELSSTMTTVVARSKTKRGPQTPARRASPVSPIQVEMAMLMNGKKERSTSLQRIMATAKEITDSRSKNPPKRKSKTNPEVPKLQINSPVIALPTVNENSSLAGNQAPVAKPIKVWPKPRETTVTTGRKIPVRTAKTESKEPPLKPVTTGGSRRKASASDIPEATRKSTRRLI